MTKRGILPLLTNIFLVSVFIFPATTALADPVVRGSVVMNPIEEFIDTELPASGVPGVAFAIVEKGEISSAGARGVQRIGEDVEVTPDTQFLIGSISKSFTALAVMQLVESGLVDVDSPISQYLTAFSDQPSGAITIRQLLSHTSGFSTLQGNSSHLASNRDNSTQTSGSLERGVDQLAEISPAYAPGQKWEYSNANYEILGRLIEVVSGQDFATYLEANILEPIGMDNSFVSDGEIHESIATGHTSWFTTKRPLPRTATNIETAPQGGVVSTANDLALYMQTVMNGADDILSAEGKAQMMQPASAISPYYGLGWYLDPRDGSVGHTGASPGIEALLTMIPATQSGAVVLTNAGSGMGFGDTAPLRTGIVCRALDLQCEDEGYGLSQKIIFISLSVLPLIYLISMAWAWHKRAALRVKARSGAFGLFSLWFPLMTTIAAAWVLLGLAPSLSGSSIAVLDLFVPDFALVLKASAAGGVIWAAFRLSVAYFGRGKTLRPIPTQASVTST